MVVETQQPLPVEAYATNRVGGALIVVDPASNRTSGALLVKSAGLSMGTVVFIGAGPGAADLITVRGARRLAQADVVLFDALTDPALRELAPQRDAGSTSASAASADSTGQATHQRAAGAGMRARPRWSCA